MVSHDEVWLTKIQRSAWCTKRFDKLAIYTFSDTMDWTTLKGFVENAIETKEMEKEEVTLREYLDGLETVRTELHEPLQFLPNHSMLIMIQVF